MFYRSNGYAVRAAVVATSPISVRGSNAEIFAGPDASLIVGRARFPLRGAPLAYHATLTLVMMLFVLSGVSLDARANPDSAEAPAELAVRWDPKDGGPRSLEDVVRLLNLAPGREEALRVTYFRIQSPGDASPELQFIARERSTESGTTATYKLRGPARLRGSAAFQTWACPFSRPQATHAGFDLTWVAEGAPVRDYARSCDASGKMADALPARYAAKDSGCTADVRRWVSGHLKIERWSFAGGRSVLEVSVNASDSPIAISEFRDHAVRPLIAAGARALPASKTEMASTC